MSLLSSSKKAERNNFTTLNYLLEMKHNVAKLISVIGKSFSHSYPLTIINNEWNILLSVKIKADCPAVLFPLEVSQSTGGWVSLNYHYQAIFLETRSVLTQQNRNPCRRSRQLGCVQVSGPSLTQLLR